MQIGALQIGVVVKERHLSIWYKKRLNKIYKIRTLLDVRITDSSKNPLSLKHEKKTTWALTYRHLDTIKIVAHL